MRASSNSPAPPGKSEVSEAQVSEALPPEEEARALWYALLSRLFYAPADRELLGQLGAGLQDGSDVDTGVFIDALRALQLACRDADPEALRDEYESLFVGVGKAPVTPYTSAYAASHAPDRHLVALRERLSAWGLTRREQVFEAEDHVAALCDAMRWLIVHGNPLEEQRDFFAGFIAPAMPRFCDAINRMSGADFYRKVGAFTRAFVALEQEAFDMHTPA
jgi:TorA maturation chaperone TorD